MTPAAPAQLVDGHVAPVWPGTSIVHLDLSADDLDASAELALALGATVPMQLDPRWRVLLDPAGHPFCLTPFVPPRELPGADANPWTVPDGDA